MTDAPLAHTPQKRTVRKRAPLERASLVIRTIPIFVGLAMAGMPGIAAAARGAAAAKTAAKTYVGKAVPQQYGKVQVKITVAKGRITKVTMTAPESYPRSKQINRHAVPIYDQEVLRAQKVSGVHKVSGASLTWAALEVSLADAMKAAHLPGA